MLTLDDAVPCSICGAKPILSGGWRSGRLKCPNYKSEKFYMVILIVKETDW